MSKIESQIQQLEKDIQHDDKMLASNYDKHIEDASFFTTYNKKKSELDQLLIDWETVQEEIDSLNWVWPSVFSANLQSDSYSFYWHKVRRLCISEMIV